MKVIKRNGEKAAMRFDNVTNRISKLTAGLSNVNPERVAQKVFSSMYDGQTTQEIDDLSSEICIAMITDHTEYEVLATRILASNIQKQTPSTFKEAMLKLNLDKTIIDIVNEHADVLNKMIKKNRDNDINFFGLKTLVKGYLMKDSSNQIVETPQYMYLRVSLGIHGTHLDKVRETYDAMSQGFFIHATPTLFNAATPRPQMSSCFLVATKDDSIDGIYDTIKECAQISKWAGGIGTSIHNIRSTKSKIRGTNGHSDGIVPMLRVFNATARYVNQAGKRKGSIAIYLEPWHADIMEFLDLRLNSGDEDSRTRDLFTALWIPDLFMQRVADGGNWSLFCPDESPGLSDVWGDDFVKLYERYEKEGRARSTIPASKVWLSILRSQTETGTPYMLYKDACNKKSNHNHLGTIKHSNLCTEIVEYTAPDETAVCNLGSLALPKFVDDGVFNYEKLYKYTRILTRNLNRVIDANYYPVETARNSNMRHRPIGLGVQGLADVFGILNIPFDSPEAREINIGIFETIYYAALEESCAIAKDEGAYDTWTGSMADKGILQIDIWDRVPKFTGLWNWVKLKDKIKKFGLRNSLLVAPMPTASTSQILGNNECIEPYTSNIYIRRTLAGEFVVINKHLVKKLEHLGLWCKELKDKMIAANGSVADLTEIPQNIRECHRTVWEISQKSLIDMARDRGCFIDQSQSLNLFMENPTVSKLSSMHMHAWKQGLKTGMYYLRTRAKTRAIQVTLEPCTSCSA